VAAIREQPRRAQASVKSWMTTEVDYDRNRTLPMATTLSTGDIAVVRYSSSTDAFTFVFLRDVEAGTIVNFTDNGWLAAGGFRGGESTVTYTAPSAVTAGTIVTLSGLDLDAAGDQIIAYQGDPASPAILHLIDFADGNNTVAGDATDAQTTALPPGFTLGVNAVAVAFDSSLYAGPTSGSPEGLFAALNNSANWLEGDALPVPLIFNAKPTIDLDADNSTHTGSDYETSVTSGGPAVPVAGGDIAISDDDGTDIFAADIKIRGSDARDLLAINGSLPAGIVATSFNSASGTLRLEGQASHADYGAAIRQVEFSTTDTPGDLKHILISVYDGKSWSKDATAFINIVRNLTAAPPALDLDANNSSAGGGDATATYTAGGPAKAVTDIDVTITDADSPAIQSAAITILGWALHPGDVLSIAGSLPDGITASSYNASTGVITFSGAASLADYQTALRQVVYSSTLPTPSTADRGIQVTVTDDVSLTSNITTMYMHVVVPPPNIAPVLDLDANNSTTPGANYLTGFTEGGPSVALADTDILIIDPDSPSLASATITLTNPQTDDVLTFNGAPPAGISVSGSGTAAIALTGLASSANYQTALQQITFSNGNIAPSNVTRVIEVVVNDGASDSNIATAVVQVEAVNNSAPVVDLDPNESGGSIRGAFHTNFTENGTPIPIADTDTTITDLDSTTLASATITLANQHPGDLLTVARPLPGGIVASGYDPGTGMLALVGVATLAEYEAALQQVLYSNTSDNPATDDRLIEVVVNDGANASNVAATLIGVVAVNDAPVLQVDTQVTYFENAAAIALSPLATLTDVDDTELNDVVVRITGGVFPGDGDTLTVGGSTSGTINGITFLWDPAADALVFTGASLVANYQDLLRQVAFNSSSDNPTDFNASSARTLTWSVSGGIAVTTATTTLDIVAVNDAPQATVAATASYTENGAPVVLSPAATVTDVDDINLVSGEVRIVSGKVGGDLLAIGGLQSGTFSGIDFSYDATQHSLTFSGPATVADYQTLLQAIEFSSTSDNPTDSGLSPTRTLSWFVFDGDALSDVQTTVVSITAVNDAPVNTVPGAQTVNEDTALPIAGVSVADADGGMVTTTLSVANGTLHVTGSNGVSDNDTGTVTISGTAAEINAALAGLSYTGNLNFNGPDTLTVSTSDGALTDTGTVAITINPVNDEPTANPDTASVAANAIVTGNVLTNDTDPDHDPLDVSSVNQGVNLVGQSIAGKYGTLILNADGTYTYTANNSAPPGAPVTDTFTYTVTDHHGGSDALFVNFNAPDYAPGSINDQNGWTVTGSYDQSVVSNGLGVDQGLLFTRQVTTGSFFDQLFSPALTQTAAEPSEPGAVTAFFEASWTMAPQALETSADAQTGFIGISMDHGSGIRGNLLRLVNDASGNWVLHAFDYSHSLGGFTDTIVAELPVGVATTIGFTQQFVNGPGNDIWDVCINDQLVFTGTGWEDFIRDSGDPSPVSYERLLFRATGSAVIGDQGVIIDDVSYTTNQQSNLTVSVQGNNAPVNTVPGAQTVNEDTALPISGVSVADADGGMLTATLSVANGTLHVTGSNGVSDNDTRTVTISGTAAEINAALAGLSYTGNLNFNGPDTLTVSTSDGALTDTDTVAITINPVNDAPVAQDGSNSGNEDTQISGTLVATDFDSEGLTYSLGIQAAHGIVAVNSDGSYTYTPNLDFNGPDSFTFTASDGTAGSNTATISLTVNPVNDPPVAQDGTNNGDEDTTIAGTLVATDVDSEGLIYSLGIQAAHGIVAVNSDGSYTYTPNLDFNGPDSFTFTASDGTASSNTATISLTINPVNNPPVLDLDADDSTSSGSDYATTFTEHGAAVTIADTDIAIRASTLRSATITLTNPHPDDLLSVNGTLPGGVTAVYNPATGVMTLTGAAPAAAYQAAADQIVYSNSSDNPSTDDRIITVVVSDGINDSNAATTIVHLVAVNDPPVAKDGAAGGNENVAINGTLVATDVDSASLTYSLGAQAAHGVVVVNPDGTYTYTPVPNFDGTDSFTFLANDGEADSNIATINLAIAAVNDAPHLDLDADDSTAPSTYFVTTFAGADVSISDVDVAITDPDSATLAFATIHLLTPGPGDHLSVDGPLTTGISASAYDTATGILTLSGLASLADYETAIHQVEFGASGVSSASRIIEVTVNDGTLDGNAAVAVIDFSAPPLVTADPHWMATREFTPHPAGWSPIIVADLAGDPMSDLLWRSDATGSLDEWQIANAGWTRSVDLGGHPGTAWLPTATGDFNGDGTDDILWFDPTSGNTDVWKMANGEWAGSIGPGFHPPGFQVAGTGDFDGDGTSDVLWFSPQTGMVDVWKIENGQWAGSVNPGSAPAGFSIATTGDVNQDGSDDVVWFNPSSGDVEIWEMKNGQLAASVDVGLHPSGYTIVGAADFTGDGTSDILWFNPTTGDVDLWKMLGSHWAGSVDIGLHPLGWQPVGIGDTDGNGIADVWWREGTTTHVETWMLSVH
jgi:VCBS repeat-containing protein